ncbi:MAG: HEAT repeat domain-containing protein [Anaerolineae bacterium]|nr:HEAT repeat domain-containing protein [Anaerolineae bacterium]
MSKAKAFDDVLADLTGSSELFDAATVYGLSALNRQQLTALSDIWLTIAPERRGRLLQHLNTVSEANFEMDFRGINRLALSDPESNVRRIAIEGLWEDESLDYMHKLVGITREDPSLDVRAAALTELGRFILLGEYEEIPRADARLAQETVLQVLHSDEDNDIRRRALEAIANCSRPGVSDMIREFYAQDDISMRMSALFAMGRTCDAAWTEEILQELEGHVPELQYEAARAAGHIQIQEAIPYLRRMLEETDDTEILEIVIWALGEIGGEAARKILNKVIERAEAEGDEEILEAAEDALDAASLPGDLMLFDFEP